MNRKLGILLIICLLAAVLLTACGVPDLLEAVDQAEEYLASQEETQAEESSSAENQSDPAPAADAGEATVSESGQYSDPVSVALYLHTYGHLPDNYLTKSEAEALGWNNSLGNLWDVAPGCSIGGDKFGNREGLLPKAKGRQYYECDVNFDGGYRGGERIVYSNDGLIFYTADHYASYTQLY